MAKPSPSPQPPGILFTAFEPSGDAHAAPVIAEIRRRAPHLPLYAWGGPKMARAGAEIVEQTGLDAAMGAGAFGKIAEHWAINRRIRDFVRENRVAVHVPVDSPAANFPICRITRKAGCRVVHLVAPQMWAWGAWRVKKLRRLTDLVLCLLPFEEPFFNERGVPAKFIGHPVLAARRRAGDETRLDEIAAQLPNGAPKIAILPGSRPGEVRRNIGPMVSIFIELKHRHGNAVGIIAAANDAVAEIVHSKFDQLPGGMFMVTDKLDEVLHWADFGLICSGTASLDATAHRLPMLVMYKTAALPWFAIGRWLLRSPFRALPNLIAQQEIVPEFIPHFGSNMRIVEAASPYLADSKRRATQRAALSKIAALFDAHDPGPLAAEAILERVVER